MEESSPSSEHSEHKPEPQPQKEPEHHQKKKREFSVPSVNYKLLMLIPVILIIGSAGFLVYNYTQTGEWFLRSVELRGGTVITFSSDLLVSDVQQELQSFDPLVKEVTAFSGRQIVVQVSEEQNTQEVLSGLRRLGVDTDEASVVTVGASLSESFWTQAQTGLITAFILMGIVVFVIFRKPAPSIAVIFAVVSDIVFTLAAMQVFGIELSLAALGALLMLIGYSVDTDILLTTRLLKNPGQFHEKLRGAFKTGITMTITTSGALITIILIGVSPVLTNIALVLLIGLLVDVPITWFTNVGILRMYMERRGMI